MKILKKIFTFWLSFDGKIPEVLQECLESQKIPGYEHVLITLDNCYKGSPYVNGCIAKAKEEMEKGNPEFKKWLVKATDWLRCYHLWESSGIHLDADMYVLPGKNFDDLLDHRMFTGTEVKGNAANAGFGAEKGHPFLKRYMEHVEQNFIPEGPMVYDPGIRAFSDVMWMTDKKAEGIYFYDPEVFFPFDHTTGNVVYSDKTRVLHLYTVTWGAGAVDNTKARGELLKEFLNKYEQSK